MESLKVAVWGLFFSLSMFPAFFVLYFFISRHPPSVHGYADDTKLYFSFRSMFLECQVEATNVLESCIAELRSWLISNRFMINDIKTEFLIIDRNPSSVGKDDNRFYRQSSIKPSESVRILRSWFDAQMRMNVHIDRQIRKFRSGHGAHVIIR